MLVDVHELGTITPSAGGAHSLVFRRYLAHRPALVWAALTEPDRLGRWFGNYRGAARVGGTVRLRMTGDAELAGGPVPVHLVECTPPRRLVVDLDWTPGSTWRLALTLHPRDGATELLLEQPMPAEPEIADLATGWHWYLDRLAAALDHAPPPGWDAGHHQLHACYLAISALPWGAHAAATPLVRNDAGTRVGGGGAGRMLDRATGRPATGRTG